ncbi:MAG: RHS repeat-associated core domain-containing protein, partial [Patescibacteria group bacterium]|nr:RHS repeat-associated core domain-containing protein [Patescibacteria group bacterium]
RRLDEETGLMYYRNRMYHAELGRFVSRDPMESDPNLYRYCANNPVLLVDPSGLEWIVKRDGQSLAECCRENAGDTEAALAKQIGLDAGDIDKWLTKNDGRSFVPNTVYAVWAGEDVLKIPGINLNLGKGTMKWNDDVKYLEHRGFKVVNQDTPPLFVLSLFGASQLKTLHGLFAWGHGAPDSFGNKEQTWTATYAAIDKALNYKMGFVMLNACFSDHKAGDANITFWFPNKPLQVQVFPGPLVAGGHDLVSADGIFRGAKGILSPFQRLAFFSQIKHNFVFSHHWHPADALKPGDQETKP